MKYFIAITLIAAVASAAVVRPLRSEIAEIQEIIAAIQSPSTDPATAAALEQMLLDVLGIKPEPVVVGPAIVNPIEGIAVGPAIVNPIEGIAVGPAIIPHEPIAVGLPAPDFGAVTAPIAPSPVVIGAIPEGQSPLVQIIVNVNKATPEAVPVSPIVRPEPVAPIVRPEPVGEIPAEPVQVVEVAPVPAEPVQIGVPIIPEAAVILPEELN